MNTAMRNTKQLEKECGAVWRLPKLHCQYGRWWWCLGRESMRILSNISLYTQPIHRNMLNFDRLFCQKDLLVCVLTAEAVLSNIIFFFRHILNIWCWHIFYKKPVNRKITYLIVYNTFSVPRQWRCTLAELFH